MAYNNYSVDIRDRIIAPLRRYDIRKVYRTSEMRYEYTHSRLGSSDNIRCPPQEESIFEINISERGLRKMSSDLDEIQHEEWLRKNNPSLQQAWDHYQTVLALCK